MNRCKPAGPQLRVGTRFALTMGGIATLLFCLFAALIHGYLKQQVIEDTRERARIVLDLMEAVGAYAADTLRPRMMNVVRELTGEDEFIAEAMSTTRIRHGIMRFVEKKHSEFVYRRVADQPRNPANLADPFQRAQLAQFRADPERGQWDGVHEQDGSRYFSILRPIVVHDECLKCHGRPEQAPVGLVELYGPDLGFGHQNGEILGLETVTMSLTPALENVRRITGHVLLIGFGVILLIWVCAEGLFIQFIGQPLARLIRRFDAIAGGTQPLRTEVPIAQRDEIGDLTASFNALARHLAAAQENLETNAAVLQSIVNGIPEPLALLNSNGNPSVINQAYQSWLAEKCPVVFGAENQGTTAESLAPLLKTCLADGRPLSRQWTSPDGRHYHIQFYPIRSEQGTVDQIVHTIHDVTLLKNAARHLMQSEKMTAIGQLSAGIAHEINNPLGIILCYTTLLLRDLPATAECREDICVIERQAANCKRIVEQLLSFARQTQTVKTPGRLNESLREVVALVEHQFAKNGITIELRLDPDLPELVFDGNQLKQVWLNLLMNARQAMPTGGRITIQSSFQVAERAVRVNIADTGSGIDAEVLPRIFDPFFTTKQTGEGTGLGLSVSFGIIQEHQGDLQIESAPGKGARFLITLPLTETDGKDGDGNLAGCR